MFRREVIKCCVTFHKTVRKVEVKSDMFWCLALPVIQTPALLHTETEGVHFMTALSAILFLSDSHGFAFVNSQFLI